jgi:hypothetical protein
MPLILNALFEYDKRPVSFMTPEEFRRIALSFPDTEERSHMNHPDFRVGGKIFATLSEDGTKGMAKLKPDQQQYFLRVEGACFEPASGAWGHGGATLIDLSVANEKPVRSALNAAWRNTAPKSALAKLDD